MRGTAARHASVLLAFDWSTKLVHQEVFWLCFSENLWDLNPDWSIISRVTCLHNQQKGLYGGVFPQCWCLMAIIIMIHRLSSLILPCFLFSCLVLSAQPLACVTFVTNCVCSLWRAFVACVDRSHRPVFRCAILLPARLGTAWLDLGRFSSQPHTVWLDSVRFCLAARVLSASLASSEFSRHCDNRITPQSSHRYIVTSSLTSF